MSASIHAAEGVYTLQAFSSEIQFSCKNQTNQISQNSRVNWITLENVHSVAMGKLGANTRCSTVVIPCSRSVWQAIYTQ
jgi:hypothetical protein